MVSDDFLRVYRKRRKDRDPSEYPELLGEMLKEFLTELPEELSEDLAACVEEHLNAAPGENALTGEDVYAAVIDVVTGEAEEEEPGIPDELLQDVMQGVNDFAADISDEVLMNVMKIAVARGLLD